MLEAEKHRKSWHKRIADSDFTQREIADKLGKDKEWLNRLLKNPAKDMYLSTYKKIEKALQKLGI